MSAPSNGGVTCLGTVLGFEPQARKAPVAPCGLSAQREAWERCRRQRGESPALRHDQPGRYGNVPAFFVATGPHWGFEPQGRKVARRQWRLGCQSGAFGNPKYPYPPTKTSLPAPSPPAIEPHQQPDVAACSSFYGWNLIPAKKGQRHPSATLPKTIYGMIPANRCQLDLRCGH